MDNVTHALIGVLLARAALPWVGSLRGAVWAGVLASNLPDVDLALTPLFDDAKLGYLVHHRGHTHTLAVALPLSLAVAALARRLDPSARPAGLVGLSLVGAALHLGADAWNNYGVHPFWPLDSRWRYGDSVFIVEPWLWAALLPLARGLATWRVARWGLDGLGWLMFGLVGWLAGPVLAAAFGALVLGLRAAPRAQLAAAGAIPTLVIGASVLASRAVEADLRARVEAVHAGERVLDVALTPAPARPWCWSGWVASTDGETYRARAVLRSLLPPLDGPGACDPLGAPSSGSAPLSPPDLPSDGEVEWRARFEAPAGELRALASSECRVDAQLRFLRIPYWQQDGETLVVGDLRYDNEPGLGFAEIETRRTQPPDTRGCAGLPPWRSAAAIELGE